MDMKQIQAETEKFRAEMMAIQSKYIANPTPENLVKMQQEMMAVQQKMANLTAQYIAVAEGAEVRPESFDFDADEGDEELEQFIKDHPVPADKAKYLPIGAMLLCTNYEPYQVFAMTGEKSDWKDAMKEAWGIKNAKDGREMLASLLDGRHESVLGEDYRNFKAKKPNELDEDSIESYETLVEAAGEYLPTLAPYIGKCKTLIAWDLDRAGYLARIFVHLGWIDEKESFDWIAKVAAKIKASGFTKWEEYFASILVGRAIHMGFDPEVIAAVYEILVENKEFMKSHPFSAL